MPFFRFDKKTYGAALVAGVLALFFVAGCAARKTETPETSQKMDVTAQLKTPEGSSVAGERIAGQKSIHGITIKKENKVIEVQITGNQALAYYSIKQPFPFAICVYLPETHINPGLIPGSIEDDAIGGLKLTYADQKQTTAKLEILLNQDLSYEVLEEGALLRVVLSPPLPGDFSPSKEMATAPPSQAIPPEAVVVPDTPAVMTGIAFNTLESGRSDIRLETSHPIKYEMTRRGDRILNLNLIDTKIPAEHLRPLLTRYFNSAVEGIEPKKRPENAKDSVIEITTREQVPYRISQDQNVITLVFEPSQVAPPLFDKAQKERSGAMVTKPLGVAETSYLVPGETAVSRISPIKKAEKNLIPGQAPPRYTGEKIKLDFYDTDIKNVFRILRSVSGLNFAIDKDVQGKVTMTLEEPVPWDQVLDLVLKMNGLGKKNEGNVIRIATIASLQNEEVILQNAIAAQKKSLEQKESFEPLVTQYIPINYSDAEGDIKPHIEQILSKDRGKISVDQRTNMIILTDTQAKVDQAQEIIFRLDTVTPQIMIEAKVVEVTKEFAR
ncbi:MAG: secretin and TonB N-terminal domain-containing protein, partial [Proteobacteria bacterium]|nr:secretin and TonB N-terminal domain-containing protein [Pseudomonadota bacterium]